MNRFYALLTIMMDVFCHLSFAIPQITVPISSVPKSNFFVAQVQIDNVFSTTQMIIDTGASDTILADWFVSEQKINLLKDVQMGTDSGGEGFQARKAKISSLTLGGRTRKSEFIFVVPTPPPFVAKKIGGILSPQSFFFGDDFLIDFPRQKLIGGKELHLRLKDRKLVEQFSIKPCSEQKKNKYLLHVSVNGIPGWFYPDTGGKRSAMTQDFAKRLGNLKGTTSQRIGMGSKRTVETIPSLHLTLGKIETDVAIDVEPKKVSCPTADGKIGNDFLKKYALLFNAARTVLVLYK